jgi:thioredoxin 1
MTTHGEYEQPGPTREEVDATRGPVVVDFGTNWCGYCQAARPIIESAFVGHPNVRHVKVEDGPGRPLGRSFRVKLWPTLVFLKDGQEVARVVRPGDEDEVRAGLEALAGGPAE